MGQCITKTPKHRNSDTAEDIAITPGAGNTFKDVISEIQAFGESLSSLNVFWEVEPPK